MNVTPGYRTFTDKVNGTVIEYPENWTMEVGHDFTIARFYPPGVTPDSPVTSVTLSHDHMSGSHKPPGLYDLYQFAIRESFVMDFRNKSYISPVSDTSLAGRPAYIMNYSTTSGNRTVNGTIVYMLDKSWFDYNDGQYDYYTTRYYVIEYSADEREFDRYRDEAFHMMRSFDLT